MQIIQQSDLAKACTKIQQEHDGVRAGDVVRLSARWQWGMLDAGAIGMISGERHRSLSLYRKHVSITFSYSAFRDDKVVSCSGGPGTIATPVTKLIATGDRVLAWYWRWKNGHADANNSEQYAMYVPVWEWDGTND